VVFSLGPMAEDMTVTTLMTRKKDTVNSTGQMAESTKVDGKMVSNMVLVPIHQQVVKPNKANGRKVKDLIGSQVMLMLSKFDEWYEFFEKLTLIFL